MRFFFTKGAGRLDEATSSVESKRAIDIAVGKKSKTVFIR
jgi:hypothetical protein